MTEEVILVTFTIQKLSGGQWQDLRLHAPTRERAEQASQEIADKIQKPVRVIEVRHVVVSVTAPMRQQEKEMT